MRIVGYLPDWRIEQWDPAPAQHLTHLMYFSIEPHADGSLDTSRVSPSHLGILEQIRGICGARIGVCVGGWKRGTEQFAAMSVSPPARARFVADLLDFCRQHHFGAADFDWEFPANAAETEGYSALIVETAKAFAPQGIELSVAVNPGLTLTVAAIAALDHVFLMAYDDAPRHSTLEFAERMIQAHLDRGEPAHKLVLGVPFYGRPIVNTYDTGGYRPYQRLRAEHPDLRDDQDEVDGIYFNNLATIRRKMRLARQRQLGGVGMWEITEDAAGQASLLSAMADELSKG